MKDQEIINLFEPLWKDITPEGEFYNQKPLLAHYTSIHVLEKILQNNEIWFSNPLFMNDLEEVKFGINESYNRVLNSSQIATVCGTDVRAKIFKNNFDHFYLEFANDHVFDTYIFCLSEHKRENVDGVLSMWRGYGANGNGVAIVFDAGKLGDPVENSPITLARVSYASTEARHAWIDKTILEFSDILKAGNLSDDQLYLAAYSLFERLKMFAIYTKHDGFREENEWRAVYLKSRDTEGKLKHMYHYLIGSNGIQPRLRFEIKPMEGVFSKQGTSLEEIIDQIILGPTTSSPMAIATIVRMMQCLNRTGLINKVKASTIPFRS